MKNIELSILNNNLEARIILINDFEELSVEYILNFLVENKIVYGIKKENIYKVVRDREIGKSIIVAQGVEAIEEKPKTAFLVFDRSKVLPMLGVNLSEMVLEVVEGQPLVKLSKFVPGKPGRNIFGAQIEIESKKGDALPKGTNTEVSSTDRDMLISTVSGQVVIEDGKISVHNIQEINRNIGTDMMTMGSLVVKGDILDGVKLKVSNDLHVKGNVFDAKIEVGGILKIDGNVVGKTGSKIKAGGNITAKYIENAEVYSGGDIYVERDSLNSKLESGGEVIVKERIVGGSVSSEKKVSAREIGEEGGLKTIIQTGIDARKERILKEIILKINESDLKNKKLKAALLNFGERLRKGQLTTEEEEKYRNFIMVQKKVEEYLKQLLLKRDQLSSIIGKSVDAEVSASSYIYFGVEIIIQGINTKINQITQGGRFRMLDWTIVELE